MILIKYEATEEKIVLSFFFFNLKKKYLAYKHQVGRLAQIQHIEVIFLESSRTTEF